MDAWSAVERIARTCLYEGYLLWPYRRAALKNARRWTFGAVFPAGAAEPLGEPCYQQTECLLTGGDDADLAVRVRFLHLVERTPLRDGRPVDSLTVAGRRHLAWQEATERDLHLPGVTLGELAERPRAVPLAVAGGSDREHLADGRELLRTWQPLSATAELRAVRVAAETVRLTVRIANTTDCPPPDREARDARDRAAGHALLSTHAVLHSGRGRFVSLTDPPERLRDQARGCDNHGCWPVLVGDEHTVLSSPITLQDYPEVAPESPGDLFDGTEIDQLLVLGVLSMSDEERAEMAAGDPRAREILERCTALGPRELGALHGGIRSVRPLTDVPLPDAPLADATLEDA